MTMLSAKEQLMYDEITLVIDGTITHEQAALKLGVTTRTIYRKVASYLSEGTEGLAHKSRGSIPHNTLSFEDWVAITTLYKEKYQGYNFAHFRDMLEEREGIVVSYSTIYTTLDELGYKSPRAHRKSKKKLHPVRERKKNFGELVQMDGSIHLWFGDRKAVLHLAIDDATSHILGGHFAWSETLDGYYEVFYQIVTKYGIPYSFYTDRRAIFEYRKSGSTLLKDDAHTQFRLAAAQLGVTEMKATSVPQAKGRIERAFGTFQDRLINEMKTANITTIEQANGFLQGFIERHNIRFALDYTNLPSLFGPIPSEEEVNLALARVIERKVLSGCIISYKGKKYFPSCDSGKVYLPKGTSVLAIKTYDERLLISLEDNLWPLVPIDEAKTQEKIPIPEGRLYEERRYRYLIKKYQLAA